MAWKAIKVTLIVIAALGANASLKYLFGTPITPEGKIVGVITVACIVAVGLIETIQYKNKNKKINKIKSRHQAPTLIEP